MQALHLGLDNYIGASLKLDDYRVRKTKENAVSYESRKSVCSKSRMHSREPIAVF